EGAGALGEGRNLNAEFGIAEGAGRAVAEKSAALQRAAAQFQGKRIGAPGEIELADFKDAPRRRLNLAAGRAGSAGEPLHYEATAVTDGIALGFFDQHHDILFRIGAGGVLRSNGDAVEDTEVVEAPLRVNHLPFAQGLGRFDLNLALDDIGARVV